MKYGCFTFALMLALLATPLGAFELKNAQRAEPRLKIELEPVPSQLQQDFDQYIHDLAAAARRDVDSPPEKKDRFKELQAKAVNPIVLFRW
jgi:hypothetical protein